MIALSMRMTRTTYPDGGEELRDALAHDWWRFFQAVLPDMPVLPIPNIGENVENFLHSVPLTGIVLTGGDDWGVFPQRDMTEELLFHWAARLGLPVLGVCRGAQVINRLLGGKTGTGFEEGHVRTRHSVAIRTGAHCPLQNTPSLEVNSYHMLGINQENLALGLEAWALASDGSVEAFTGEQGSVMGIMWHPEREKVPSDNDVCLVRHLFMRRHS